MSIFLVTLNRRLLVATTILAILGVEPLPAQQQLPQPPKLDPAALDNVVARVALYPDPLLAQVLAAATFVEQITAASQWAGQHRNIKGDALVQAIESANLGFDPSVQALLVFPSVLDLMNQDLGWTATLGDATLVQRGDVMDAVQRMRKSACDAGNLKSSPQMTVVQSSPQVIVIQPPSPTVIYVPVYNPQVVYVATPRPAGAVVVAAALSFAVAVAMTPSYCNSYWGYRGGFGWASHTLTVYNGAWGRTWVNRNVYVHTWGGYNRGFYARPYAYVNTHAYVRKPSYAGVNTINVNKVNVNTVNRNTVNQSINRNTYQAQNPNRPATVPSGTARGYTLQSTAPSGAFSGVQNGKSEQAAAARGRVSRTSQ
jgi:hypothetical protein